jgi:hypothetical protein
MSRHRFVRNLDLDGKSFALSHSNFRQAQSSFPLEERDDGALSDGGDDMTPEECGREIYLCPIHSGLLTSLVALLPSTSGSRSRASPHRLWFRRAIRFHGFSHYGNLVGLLL